jgi:hypothetical protein
MTKITTGNTLLLAKKIAELEINETLDFYLAEDCEDANFATMLEVCDRNVILIGQYGEGHIVCFDCTYLTDAEIASDIEPLLQQFIETNCFGEVYIDD